jgi:hypothetical protein
LFAELCGWDVPDGKSPTPAQVYLAVGYKVNHVGTPSRWARLQVSELRREGILKTIDSILQAGRLDGGLAGSVWGKLGFAMNALYGKYGRAMLRPLSRRQHERRNNLNRQLEACLKWWRKLLTSYVPRAIPTSLEGLPVAVSYSDGEGSGGFGAALWHPSLRQPRAAFLEVPRQIRALWAMQKERDLSLEFSDIYEIEAIGPLVVASMWPDLLRGMLWIHFIDNEGALATLVRGSSRVASGNVLMSWTWQLVVELRAWLWCDRVESDSNPVDGLSRGRMQGPWSHVETASIPAALIRELQRELEVLRADRNSSTG